MDTPRIIAALSLAVSAALAWTAPAAAAGGAYTDAEILGIVGAANHGELDAAELAGDRSPTDAVKKFAGRMLKDHGDAKQELVDVEAKAGLTPADTELSNGLTKRAADESAMLEPLDGSDFDAAYVDAQVADHEALLRALDEELIPSAKDPSVAALLRRLRPIVSRHLDHARRLQAGLERRKK